MQKLHKFQETAFYSDKPIIVMSAGIQSGKTTLGAIWSGYKAYKGPKTANHIIVAPTYKILQQATLPKFLQLYGKNGTYNKVESTFRWAFGPTTFIRSLTDPNAIEGITDVESIWADELGMFSRYAWENVMGRAAFKQAQIIGTTTPYALNWLYRMWKENNDGKRDDVEFVTFKSIDNPFFPKKEFERQQRLLDPIRFKMKYEGIFGQMEGLVFPDIVSIPSIPLPAGTRYYAGVDWGYTNPFALVIRALTPDGFHYRVAEYYKTKLTIDEMVGICLARKSLYNIELFVCDPAEPKSIASFNKAGLNAIPGNNHIRAGLDVHARIIKENRFFIFEDMNPNGLDEYASYHYPEEREIKIDDHTKEQLPVNQHNHSIDADRYISMYLEDVKNIKAPIHSTEKNVLARPKDNQDRIRWLKKGGSSMLDKYKV